MRILVVKTHVPFVRGGAEIHAEELCVQLTKFGHQAEIAAIPFKWYPAEKIIEHMLATKLLDISESCGDKIDLVIGLKFPAYLIEHPNKVIWLLHQYRTAYDLWNSEFADLIHSPLGTHIRSTIINADNAVFAECKSIYCNSDNVAQRLLRYNQVTAPPLYHPPRNADKFYQAPGEGYFFYPSRLSEMKRQLLVIEAFSQCKGDFKLVLAGKPDNLAYQDKIKKLIERHHLQSRVILLGSISEQDKIDYYAKCLGVIYTPFDEDYGYVTLEAMLSSKPVITCTDSGGPLEFIQDTVNGLVVESQASELASAMDKLATNINLAADLGMAAKQKYQAMNISWEVVVAKLTS